LPAFAEKWVPGCLFQTNTYKKQGAFLNVSDETEKSHGDYPEALKATYEAVSSAN